MTQNAEFSPAGSACCGPKQPLVSVILPVYNGERFVAQTIESARCQSYANLEIIVVDDGSTDQTLTVVESIALLDPRIKMIRQPNGGVASARNRGLAAALASLRGTGAAFTESGRTV